MGTDTFFQGLFKEVTSFKKRCLSLFFLIPAVIFLALAWAQENQAPLDVSLTLQALIQEEDTDGDFKITRDDFFIPNTRRGDKEFSFKDTLGKDHAISGVYPLSIFLQELKLAQDQNQKTKDLGEIKIKENPVDRTSRMIREVFWDGLTRRIDENGLSQILKDEKTKTIDGFNYLYVPYSDQAAYDYFQEMALRRQDFHLKVVKLPERITPEFVRKLDGYHGLLSLALKVPFVVPGGRFNEMYGWDSYFIALGLLEDGHIELARSMVDNFVYQIAHYGKILNANRSYYLTRSQPPFLSSMALALYQKLPETQENKEWLKSVLSAAIREYETIWMSPPRYISSLGLSRYFGEGLGPCPEVEEGHYDPIVKPYAEKLGVDSKSFLEGYKQGQYKNPELDLFFIHDRSVRESGHDTTYRFDNRTADFASVDLNTLVYKIEKDIAWAIETYFGGVLEIENYRERASVWRKRARKRKSLINKYLWDAEQGLYFDYDFKNKKRSSYIAATTFYPLWAGLANSQQAGLVVKNALPHLEMKAGLAASAESSRGPLSETRPARQWDYPYGWAPHQILVWQGLKNYGFTKEAERLSYRWLYTITINATQYNGTVPEKFDVVEGSHQVFAEYGNVGVKFAYITKEGFGWMNASYQIGLKNLPSEKLKALQEF